MTDRRFNSVAEMVESVLGDESLVETIEHRIASREVVSALATLRASEGVSQAEIAEELGCTQSRVSKIESGVDSDLRLRDLTAYAKATGHEVLIAFRKQDETLVERVKFHAFGIKESLGKLAVLANTDSAVAEGIAMFHVEALLNLARLLHESAKDLPSREEPTSPLLRIMFCEQAAGTRDEEASCGDTGNVSVPEAMPLETAPC